MLEERGWRGARGQDGEGPAGGVGQQGVCVGGSGGVGGAAVVQVCEGVRVHSGRDEGVRTQGTIVAVPLFAAEVGTVRLHLTHKQTTNKYKQTQTNNNI